VGPPATTVRKHRAIQQRTNPKLHRRVPGHNPLRTSMINQPVSGNQGEGIDSTGPDEFQSLFNVDSRPVAEHIANAKCTVQGAEVCFTVSGNDGKTRIHLNVMLWREPRESYLPSSRWHARINFTSPGRSNFEKSSRRIASASKAV
jgi:hypothetical protein